MTDKPRHKEAFALMWYACPCGHRERIWNSRDGVTPFGGVRCPSCNSTTPRRLRPYATKLEIAISGHGVGMEHVDWQLDTPAPDHKLAPGQRFWRDGTVDEAVAVLERRFITFEALGRTVPQDVRENLLAEARACTGEFQPGWPKLDRNSDQLEIPGKVG